MLQRCRRTGSTSALICPQVHLSIAREHVPNATFVVGDFTRMTFRPSSFDGVVAFYAFDHVAQEDVEPTFASIFAWLRPGGWLMTSLQTIEAEDRVEDWLGVPMFFASLTVPSYERLLGQAGFELELSSSWRRWTRFMVPADTNGSSPDDP
jgi:cyclopropane fatty-acyl-phospholipid synthase-like methyltransferase